MLAFFNQFRLVIAILGVFLIMPETGRSESFIDHYKFPPLDRVPYSDGSYTYLKNSMVMKRLKQIPVKWDDIAELENYPNDLRIKIQETEKNWPTVYKRIDFKGIKSSELNELIKKNAAKSATLIEVLNTELEVDEPLKLANNVFIDGNNVRILPNKLTPSVLVDGISNAGLKSIYFDRPDYAIQVNHSKKVIFSQLKIDQAIVGITVSEGSQFLTFNQLNIFKTKKSAFVIQGNSQYIGLINSQISYGQSAKNEAAAVLITDVVIPENQLYLALTKHSSVFYQPILSDQPTPHHILIENNIFNHNRSQGIYLDGTSGVVISENNIIHNDKEGLCLDFGASNNIVSGNTINANGNRAYQTDLDLQRDLIYGFGRMPNGSANAKLPGISLDNAAQNVIVRNSISNNAGDGIKIVRSGFRNIIMFNSIIDNNQGQNNHFHFFGILLGSAEAEPEVKSSPHRILDFFPSIENIVMGNMIYGQHYASVMLDKGSAFNDIYDNVARQYKREAIEKVTQSFNSDIGNSWNKEKKPKISNWLKKILD